MKHIDDYLDKIDKLIGTKIYSLRLDRNMTQAELAKKLGISSQQIQKYETAKNKINASRLALVSKVLDKDVAYFYESAWVEKYYYNYLERFVLIKFFDVSQ